MKILTTFVTVIMPIRNEANYIERSLSAVLAQDYPPDQMEIIVVDGMSTDDTQNIVRSFQSRHANLQLIDNPGKIVATGLNTAVAQAKEARTALDLFENYESDSFKGSGFYIKIDFLKLAGFLGVKRDRAVAFIDRFFTRFEKTLELAHCSLLSEEAKERFLVLFDDRLKAIEKHIPSQ